MESNILVTAILFISSGVSLVASKTPCMWCYETNCPGTRTWFKRAIAPNWEQFLDYIDLILVPYGNAQTLRVNGQISVTCQHGQKECVGNMFQACALNLVPDEVRRIRYCMCVMTTDGPDVYRKCAEDRRIQIDFDMLNQCVFGPDGVKYLAAFGDVQHNQNFKVPYSPFCAIDGQPMTEEERNLAYNNYGQVMCNRIQGEKPKFCNVSNVNAEI